MQENSLNPTASGPALAGPGAVPVGATAAPEANTALEPRTDPERRTVPAPAPAAEPALALRTDPAPALHRLVGVVDALRENCGWTARLSPQRLAPYLVEEAAEVSETVAAGELGRPLASELGDILFQIMLHARLGEERGDFTLTDVVEALESKLLRRNTHVFDVSGAVLAHPDEDPGAAERAWQAAKAAERAARGEEEGPSDPLRGLPASLSALSLAQKALGRAEGSLEAFGAGEATAPAAAPGLQGTPAPLGAEPEVSALGTDPRDHALGAETEVPASGTEPHHPASSIKEHTDEQAEEQATRIGDAILGQVRAAGAAGVDADRALRDALVRALG